MKTKEQVLGKLRAAKSDLLQKFPISQLALFGSYSKGTQDQESDVDILFHPQEGVLFGLEATLGLQDYLLRLLEVEKVDIVNKKYINPIIELDIEDSLIYV